MDVNNPLKISKNGIFIGTDPYPYRWIYASRGKTRATKVFMFDEESLLRKKPCEKPIWSTAPLETVAKKSDWHCLKMVSCALFFSRLICFGFDRPNIS